MYPTMKHYAKILQGALGAVVMKKDVGTIQQHLLAMQMLIAIGAIIIIVQV